MDVALWIGLGIFGQVVKNYDFYPLLFVKQSLAVTGLLMKTS